MRLTTSRARLIRAGILKARSQWGTARVLGENLQDLYGRAYDRTRYRDPALTAAAIAKATRGGADGGRVILPTGPTPPGGTAQPRCLPIERKPLEPHGVELRIDGYSDRVAEQQKPFRDAAKRMRAELEQLQHAFDANPFHISVDRIRYLEGAIAHQDRRIAEDIGRSKSYVGTQAQRVLRERAEREVASA